MDEVNLMKSGTFRNGMVNILQKHCSNSIARLGSQDGTNNFRHVLLQKNCPIAQHVLCGTMWTRQDKTRQGLYLPADESRIGEHLPYPGPPWWLSVLLIAPSGIAQGYARKDLNKTLHGCRETCLKSGFGGSGVGCAPWGRGTRRFHQCKFGLHWENAIVYHTGEFGVHVSISAFQCTFLQKSS